MRTDVAMVIPWKLSLTAPIVFVHNALEFRAFCTKIFGKLTGIPILEGGWFLPGLIFLVGDPFDKIEHQRTGGGDDVVTVAIEFK